MIICESQREAQGGKEVSGERGEGWWGSGVQIEEEKVELIANTNGPNECRVEWSRVVAIREEEIMQIRQGVLALKLRPS